MADFVSGDKIVIPAGTKMQLDPVYAIMSGISEVHVVAGDSIYVEMGDGQFYRISSADVVKYDDYMRDNG